MDDFLRWPKVWNYFYIYGFTIFSPEEAVLELKEENTRKFIIWGDNIKNKFASCQVEFLKGNSYDNIFYICGNCNKNIDKS